jgi:hypothetical protein
VAVIGSALVVFSAVAVNRNGPHGGTAKQQLYLPVFSLVQLQAIDFLIDPE